MLHEFRRFFWEWKAMNLNLWDIWTILREIFLIRLCFYCSKGIWISYRLLIDFDVHKLLETVQGRHRKEEFQAERSKPLTAKVKHSKSGQTKFTPDNSP